MIGGGAGPLFPSVPGSPAASSSSLGGLGGADGTVVWTERGGWMLTTNNSLTPDGVRVVAGSGAAGAARWVRIWGPGAPGATQVTAYSITATGDDASATTLASGDELAYRLGEQDCGGVDIAVSVGVGTFALARLCPTFYRTGSITFTGTRSYTGLTGTATGTAWSASGKQQAKLLYSGLASSWTAAGVVGNWVELSGHSNAAMYVGLDLGSKTALVGAAYDTSLGTIYSLTNSEAFAAYTLGSSFLNSGDESVIAPDGSGYVSFVDMTLGNGISSFCMAPRNGASTRALACAFPSDFATPPIIRGDSSTVFFGGCYLAGGISLDAETNVTLTGVYSDAIIRAYNGYVSVIDQVLSVGTSAGFSTLRHGAMQINGSASTYGAVNPLVSGNNLMEVTGYFFPFHASANTMNFVASAVAGSTIKYAATTRVALATGSGAALHTYAAGRSSGQTFSTTLPLTVAADLSGILIN